MPPTRPISAEFNKNIDNIYLFFAPIAFIIPISFVFQEQK
jgi:hypothetical protein